MIGSVFGYLTVTERSDVYRNEKNLWVCRCKCGNETMVPAGALRSGNTRSCGCYALEVRTRHGQTGTRTYTLWQAMLNRCRQQQFAKYYAHVSVCDDWKSYENFVRDMGMVPDGMTLDRIDNSKGYSKANCRWTTRTVQTRNTRRRKVYQYDGDSMSLIEWAEKRCISFEKLRGRIRRGWSFEDAITRD